jgi:multisubunit Na+/H+ antiporter MnhG subunit
MDIIMGLVAAGIGLFSLLGLYRKTKERKWAVAGIIMIMLGVMLATWDFFFRYAQNNP